MSLFVHKHFARHGKCSDISMLSDDQFLDYIRNTSLVKFIYLEFICTLGESL